jgi:dihydroorotase
MHVSLLIQNAQILMPDGTFQTGGVAIDGETIVQVGETDATADRTIDATGLVLLPGVIDPQVHFREPGLEHKEDLHTASSACVRGGVTSFLEMPNTIPLTITQAALDDKLQRAASKSLANYGFFVGATSENLPDLQTATPACGIKIFMGSQHGALLVDDETHLDPIFATGTRLIAVHAEDQARINDRKKEFAGTTDPAMHSVIQDSEAALIATKLAIKLSKKYQRRLHILHLSTGIEAEYLRTDKPAWVTVEVTPQHLTLNTDDYAKLGNLIQMNPPIRTAWDNETLWKALLDGVIDFIATDHAPHTLEEKAKGYPYSPSGMPGVETSLAVMLTHAKSGKCTVAQVSNWMSTAVAQAYHIPKKGLIQSGYDADLVLVDLEHFKEVKREDVLSKCGWNPFEGRSLTGWAIYTIVLGQVAFEDGKCNPNVRGKALQFDA